MIYRYSISLDRRLRRTSIAGITLMGLLLLGAFLSAIRGSAPIIGFAIIVGTFLIAWLVRRFVKSHLNTWIQTTDDALICKTPSGDKIEIAWNELSHAGSVHTTNGEKMLYCYSNPKDRFVCIPPSFENLEDLYKELQERIELEDVTMGEKETAGDTLRRYFADSSSDSEIPESEQRPDSTVAMDGNPDDKSE